MLMIMHAAASHAEPLATAEVQYREVDVTYAAEAVVEATRQSTVSAQTTGRIVELRYDVGDVVQKGQVIARIDQTELAQVVAGGEAQVAQAKAAYENTRVEAERTRDLARQKFVSQAALGSAEAALRIADAQLKGGESGRRSGDDITWLHDDHRALHGRGVGTARRTGRGAVHGSQEDSF